MADGRNQAPSKRLYRVSEAASYLGLSPRTIYNGLGANSESPFPVPHKKRGKVVLFEKGDLDKFADSIPYADGRE